MANNAILTSQGNIDAKSETTIDLGSSIISHTHAALAMAVLAINLSQDIKAQEVQKETTPPVAVTAEKPVSKEIPGATITFEFRVPEKTEEVKQLTKDGREYAKLTEKEVDELSRSEKKEYYKWKEIQIDIKISEKTKEDNKLTEEVIAKKEEDIKVKEEVIALDEGIKVSKEEVIALDEGIGAKKKIIESLGVTEKILDNKIAELNSQITASRLEMGTKASLSIAPLLERVDKGEKGIKIDPDLKEAIIMIADGKLPPPGMQENAKKLIPFLA